MPVWSAARVERYGSGSFSRTRFKKEKRARLRNPTCILNLPLESNNMRRDWHLCRPEGTTQRRNHFSVAKKLPVRGRAAASKEIMMDEWYSWWSRIELLKNTRRTIIPSHRYQFFSENIFITIPNSYNPLKLYKKWRRHRAKPPTFLFSFSICRKGKQKHYLRSQQAWQIL